MNIDPTGKALGATVTGIDLTAPLTRADFATILRALGQHGVLRFPQQRLSAAQLRDFSQRFGPLQSGIAAQASEPTVPEVSVLSNIIENGKPIGIPDAGQSWHTDMTYNQIPGYVNVLVAYQVPMRDGKVLGSTEFVDMAAAYDTLPADVKSLIEGKSSWHDLNLYWEYMIREKASTRAPLTPEQAAARRAQHPVVTTHPVSGRKVLFVNPGYCSAVEGLPRAEGEALMQRLLDHALQPQFRYVHEWQVDDLVIWDNLWTWHNARADYLPTEHRHMKRCQVLAHKIVNPDWVRESLAA